MMFIKLEMGMAGQSALLGSTVHKCLENLSHLNLCTGQASCTYNMSYCIKLIKYQTESQIYMRW